MKKLYRLKFLLLVPLLFACEEEGFWNSFDNKLEGQWEFYAAYHEDAWSIGRDDIYDNYQDYIFDIYEDGYFRVYYFDINGEEVFVDGEWINWREEVINDNGNYEDVRFIEFRLNDNSLRFFNRMVWEVQYLSNQKLKAREWVGDGENLYKLRKIN